MKRKGNITLERELVLDNLQSRWLVLTRFRAFNSRGFLRWRLGMNSNGILPADYYYELLFEVLFNIYMIIIFFEEIGGPYNHIGFIYIIICSIFTIRTISGIINECKQIVTLLNNRKQVLEDPSIITFERPNIKMKMLVYNWDSINGDVHRALTNQEKEMYLPLDSKDGDVNGLVKIDDQTYYVDKKALLTPKEKREFIYKNVKALLFNIGILFVIVIGAGLLGFIVPEEGVKISTGVIFILIGISVGLLYLYGPDLIYKIRKIYYFYKK